MSRFEKIQLLVGILLAIIAVVVIFLARGIFDTGIINMQLYNIIGGYYVNIS